MKSSLKIDTRVRSLKYFLGEFEKGAFQIPSFQRDFLWEIPAILQLFDSIKNKYPIGSIQFWQPAEEGEVWLDKDVKIGPYRVTKNSTEPKPIFILDGLQRLSSLFGCLINPEKYNKDRLDLNQEVYDEKFRIYYDLEDQNFCYLRRNVKPKQFQVPLYALINTTDFRKYSRQTIEKIEDESKIDLYLSRADVLGNILNDYEIASVDILNASVEEAVEIFWRVNKEGLEISKDWIVNALTNDSTFKLKDEMDLLIERLKIYNFNGIKRDILFNCIQSSFGKLSFDVDVVSLIKKDRSAFITTTQKTIISIEKAVQFLFENINVLSHKLLPSNWQLIFIVEFFNIVEEPTITQLNELKKWFWVTVYSNYFTLIASNPSKRGRAFLQFKNYFKGIEETELIFNDEPNEPISSPKYKFSTFGSVRFCANVLFQLKDYEISSENCLGFETIKLINKESESLENLVYLPILIKDTISILNNKKHKDLSFLLSQEYKGKFSELFITDDIRDAYADLDDNEVLKLRLKLIMEKEEEFVREDLKIDYLK
ncbi:DUF262 domain-containing protein [Flavobacterium sp.]|uniref:GmrSD restriction endonuclease domain-containing protein n=1 Tax=Flavobacterium sp. TaxID=239 RepID=UPI00374DA150